MHLFEGIATIRDYGGIHCTPGFPGEKNSASYAPNSLEISMIALVPNSSLRGLILNLQNTHVYTQVDTLLHVRSRQHFPQSDHVRPMLNPFKPSGKHTKSTLKNHPPLVGKSTTQMGRMFNSDLFLSLPDGNPILLGGSSHILSGV